MIFGQFLLHVVSPQICQGRHHRFEQSEDRRYRYRFLRGLFCGVDHRAQFDDIFFMETCCMIHSRQSLLEFCVVTKFSQRKGCRPNLAHLFRLLIYFR